MNFYILQSPKFDHVKDVNGQYNKYRDAPAAAAGFMTESYQERPDSFELLTSLAEDMQGGARWPALVTGRRRAHG